MPSSINIVDTLTLEDGRKIKDCIEKNCLIFYIKLPTPTSTTLSVKANNVDTKWGFSGELTQLLSTAKKNGDSGLIKCYAEYINGTFTVHCTNGMNLKPGEGGTVEIETTESISSSSTHEEVPSARAVYNYVQDNKGIDVGTKDSSFENDNDTTGFLSGVSKLNFKGALVNVIKKDDGTVDLWINPDNNYGKIDASSTSWTAPTGVTSKYVFDGNSYDIPTTNGATFARCHAVANDPTITLKGKKGNTVNTTFSIDNLTSKIKAVVYNKNSVAKATCTTDVLKSGASTKNENNIKITIGSLKEYTEADAEGGFVPGTVSLSCSVTPDISAIFGEGDTWSMKVFLVNGVNETLLYSSEQYFAYTTKSPVISTKPTVSANALKYRWVSGVKYIAQGSTFDVTYGTMSNTTYMIADNATKRGTLALTSCTTSDITGSTNDKQSTIIQGGTKTFTLNNDNTARTSLTATHTAISNTGTNTTSTGTYSGTIWSSGTEDTYNTAYFEREDSPSNGYGRIVGHINSNGTLVIDSTTFDSTQPLTTGIYANQAKVYNGTLVYGSGTDNKYYVRKFKKSTTSTAGLLNFKLTAPGRVMNGSNMEIWYYPASNLSFANRIDATSPNGIGVASGTNDINVTVPTTVPVKENEDFYIVVVLKNTNAKITSDMKVA